jgi:hypothetical protein
MSSQTKERDPNSNHPPEIGRIIEKIKRSGSNALNDNERMIVVQIFRTEAMNGDKRLAEIRRAIQNAHLAFCFKMEGIR